MPDLDLAAIRARADATGLRAGHDWALYGRDDVRTLLALVDQLKTAVKHGAEDSKTLLGDQGQLVAELKWQAEAWRRAAEAETQGRRAEVAALTSERDELRAAIDRIHSYANLVEAEGTAGEAPWLPRVLRGLIDGNRTPVPGGIIERSARGELPEHPRDADGKFTP